MIRHYRTAILAGFVIVLAQASASAQGSASVTITAPTYNTNIVGNTATAVQLSFSDPLGVIASVVVKYVNVQTGSECGSFSSSKTNAATNGVATTAPTYVSPPGSGAWNMYTLSVQGFDSNNNPIGGVYDTTTINITSQ